MLVLFGLYYVLLLFYLFAFFFLSGRFKTDYCLERNSNCTSFYLYRTQLKFESKWPLSIIPLFLPPQGFQEV